MVQQGITLRHIGLVLTTSSSPEPGRDIRYMVHPPGGMLEVGKGLQHQLNDQFLVVQARCARFSTATSLRNDPAHAAGVRVSTQTVRRRLHEGNLGSRRHR
jgi:hypothetical protein